MSAVAGVGKRLRSYVLTDFQSFRAFAFRNLNASKSGNKGMVIMNRAFQGGGGFVFCAQPLSVNPCCLVG